MTNDTKLLNDLRKSAEMGRDGILHVMPSAQGEAFRKVLEHQLADYQNLYDEASRLLIEKGGEPEDVRPMAKAMSYVSSEVHTLMDNSSSHIADMVIQGSTMGITKVTKRLHEYDGSDSAVVRLADKQLRKQQANIDELKKYL